MNAKTLSSRTIRDQRGAALALVALSMIALLSAVALAVDGGMLLTARTEAQRAADSGAIAGAQVLAVAPDDSIGAVQKAIEFAERNDIRRQGVTMQPEDVTVDLDLSRVYVNVRRIEARGNAVPTFFARIFGVHDVNVTASAAAEAAPAGNDSGAECLLPIMLPDRWSEVTPGFQAPTADDSFDPPGSDNPGSHDDTEDYYDSETTGYDAAVIGTQIEIHKAGGGGGGLNPSWYFPWTPLDAEDQLLDNGPGAATYQDRFTNCLMSQYLPGDSILTEPGAMVGPTNFGFEDLENLDPDVVWNEDAGSEGCPVKESAPTVCYYETKRIRPMPMFDPTDAPSSGRKVVHITKFAQIFYEGEGNGNAFVARWMGYITPDAGGGAAEEGEEGAAEDIPKIIRLVK
ncbi:MAG: Tad domain-containing protein [Gemmatimonadales bacterium]|jgi:Flp pilus assembly protein TadG